MAVEKVIDLTVNYIIFYPLQNWACFSKVFPFPTLASLLQISWPPFPFCTPNVAPFTTWVLLLGTCLPGLKGPQALHRTNWIGVFSLFWLQLGYKNDPTAYCTSYTHNIRFYSKRNVSATHQIAWVGSLNPQIAWAERGRAPSKDSKPHLKLILLFIEITEES